MILCMALVLAFASGVLARENDRRHITGTFLQIDRTTVLWPASKWQQELQAMKRLGMDTLIVQATVGKAGAYYPSTAFKRAEPCGCADLIGTLLRLAHRSGIQVYLGLHQDVPNSESAYDKMVTRSIAVADELARRHGKQPAFAGWYLPHEFADWMRPGELTSAYRRLAEHCRSVLPGKPVAIAPYFTKRSLDAAACRRGWRQMLAHLKVDIVMLQDGVGCNRGLTSANVVPVYRTVSEVCRKHGVKFWGDVEVFDIRDWRPARIERVVAQVNAVRPYVHKIVVWEFNHYMSPLRGRRAEALYRAYQQIITP